MEAHSKLELVERFLPISVVTLKLTFDFVLRQCLLLVQFLDEFNELLFFNCTIAVGVCNCKPLVSVLFSCLLINIFFILKSLFNFLEELLLLFPQLFLVSRCQISFASTFGLSLIIITIILLFFFFL